MAWARRVAEQNPALLRLAKVQMNKAPGTPRAFSQAVEDSLGDYCAMMWMPGADLRPGGRAPDAGRRPGRPRPQRATGFGLAPSAS